MFNRFLAIYKLSIISCTADLYFEIYNFIGQKTSEIN